MPMNDNDSVAEKVFVWAGLGCIAVLMLCGTAAVIKGTLLYILK